MVLHFCCIPTFNLLQMRKFSENNISINFIFLVFLKTSIGESEQWSNLTYANVAYAHKC